MLESRVQNSQTNLVFSQFRNCRYVDRQTARHAAQIAILNVLRAMGYFYQRKEILKAVDGARSPNAVSIALRTRLSPRRLNRKNHKKLSTH